MITRILLENFMAHERTELPLGPGVTALTGPNNTGKSAVVEALRCVATNPPITHCIRHGAKEARVTVVLDDGGRVTWIRKKRSAGYEITLPGKDEPEEPFWKLQGKVPDEVRDLLRLDLVELETGDPVDVHVGNQREPVFLLNRPDSHAAAFFAASSESAHLLAMQKRLKDRTLEATRRERELESRRRDVETGLDGLSSLPDIALELEAARSLAAEAERFGIEIPALAAQCDRLDATASELNRRRTAVGVFKTLTAPPRLADTAGPDRLVGRMRRVRRELENTGATLAALNRIAPPPPSFDTTRLAGLGDRYRRLDATLDEARRRAAAIEPLSSPPAPFDAVRLATLCNRLVRLNADRRKADGRAGRLTDLRRPPEPAQTDDLAQRLANMRRLARDVRRAETACGRLRNIAEPPVVRSPGKLAELLAEMQTLRDVHATAAARDADLDTRLRKVADELGRVVDALGRCPTCGARLDRNAFLDDHGHGRNHDA